ncbi:protein of unknown function (DUF3560) [Parafrankia irregularis]|uniref:DUF3560 domain-containing protein n=1 Tax=Parafrankia irregularis TaxID=795642 RepID=A0A0S4R0I7_9ACTN|nr:MULTISPECIES: DUF3560 domain-containing protein [Frankiaceae]CUU60878.1 protein of unknown function (DUF3560) [Parafrankia irregularis]
MIEGTSRADRAILAPIFTRHRVRWSGLIGEDGSWYRRHSRGRAADTFRIDELADALRSVGYPVTISIDDSPLTDIAALETARIERAEDRAAHHTDAAGRATRRADARRDAADALRGAIPLGQPVLPGHHSAPGHRRDLARADRHDDAAAQATSSAGYHTDKAAAATRHAHSRHDVPAALRRLTTLEAEQRADTRALRAAENRAAGGGPAPHPGWKARLEANMTQRAAEIDYWTRYVAEQEAAGVKIWRPADFQAGDEVKAAFGGWHRVLRVNTRSLTIPHWDLEGETWRLTYDKVLDHRPRR